MFLENLQPMLSSFLCILCLKQIHIMGSCLFIQSNVKYIKKKLYYVSSLVNDICRYFRPNKIWPSGWEVIFHLFFCHSSCFCLKRMSKVGWIDWNDDVWIFLNTQEQQTPPCVKKLSLRSAIALRYQDLNHGLGLFMVNKYKVWTCGSILLPIYSFQGEKGKKGEKGSP